MASLEKRGDACLLKSMGLRLSRAKVPVSIPRPRGLYARNAMPSSRQVGTRSFCNTNNILFAFSFGKLTELCSLASQCVSAFRGCILHTDNVEVLSCFEPTKRPSRKEFLWWLHANSALLHVTAYKTKRDTW